jgi:hypothetical protein
MTEPTHPGAGQAYTRTSVERYLSAAAAERSRLGSAIAEARRRTETALHEEERLLALQPRTGRASGQPENEVCADEHPTLQFAAVDNGPVWRDEGLPTAAAVTDVGR